MPVKVTTLVSTQDVIPQDPFVGGCDHMVAIVIDVSALTSAEIDANGWLKPGVPFMRTGLLVGASGVVFGVTREAAKVAASNAAADIAAVTVDPEVAVGTIGQVNRAVMESNLGRVLTANEIAGFALAGSLVKLIA